GDDDEEPGVAVVALVDEPARRAALVRLDEADEERAFAALRAAPAETAAECLQNHDEEERAAKHVSSRIDVATSRVRRGALCRARRGDDVAARRQPRQRRGLARRPLYQYLDPRLGLVGDVPPAAVAVPGQRVLSRQALAGLQREPLRHRHLSLPVPRA